MVQKARLAVLAREAKLSPAEDDVDWARWNGTLALLADQIQRMYWAAGHPCDSEIANQIAIAKIAGRVTLPPKLKTDHIRQCPRCGRAHILPLTPDERQGRQDAVERLCLLAQAVVNQDHTPQRDVLIGDHDGRFTQVANAVAKKEEMGGGRRVPSGPPKFDGDEGAAPGHQGTGTSGGVAPATHRRHRIATGVRADNAILQDVADELRDKIARQADETALTERKRAWMTVDHGKASERQQEAQYLVQVIGLSQRSAAARMKVSLKSIQRLLKDYAKNKA